MARALAFVILAACTTGGDPIPRPEPLAPLPPPAPVTTDRFRDAEACAQCHQVADDTAALHDATGANISPVRLWRASMMALAARDPYYLAVFAEELAHAPGDRDAIETLCTRCHAPAGSEERRAAGGHLGFDQLLSGTDAAAVLGRGGVTCTACHQIAAARLGDEVSFSGGFAIGYDRTLYGRYADPSRMPMQLIVNYTPAFGAQIASAALCGTCHTVVLPTPTGEVVEQATFLEWRSSSFAAQDQPCQFCHVPTTDDAGGAITTAIAGYPSGLAARTPVGRHGFVGGNSYVLSLLADGVAWAGTNATADELIASAARDDAHLATAARLAIVDARRDAGAAVITVRVENLTGHKLPTGYPSRRIWLHVTARAGGQVVFESGRADADGAIVDDRDQPIADQPHRDTIDASDQAQIWEAVLIDSAGRATHRALDARRYGKDDRLLPAGFAPSATDRVRTASVGVDGDPSFAPGSDQVTYRIAGAPADLTLDIELCYEAIRPAIVDAIDASATPAGTRFVDLARARPVAPVVMARTAQQVP
ncbi:MAG: hypothetical protein K8W52_26220 [Deltaproteobacteria bacterium]|nr:hypothetical protein [Deltaproteobacteria bacterium]